MFAITMRYVRERLCQRGYCSTYDPDGRTTATIVNLEQDTTLMINSYSRMGFRLNNGIFVIGPVVIFPRTVLSWNVKRDGDINEDSLSIFTRLHEKLDILVVGLSENTSNMKQSVKQILQNKLNTEILPAEKACSTFNYLNSEHRFVAAALIPPLRVLSSEDELFRLASRNQLKEKTDFNLDF